MKDLKDLKVLYLTNIPSPYMVNFFSLLAKKVTLKVIFERKSSSERNNRWNPNIDFDCTFLNGLNFGSDFSISFGIIAFIFKKNDIIFISNPTSPTGIIAIFFLKFFKKKYVILSEGGFPKNDNIFLKLIKNFIFTGAFAYFSGNPTGDQYFLKYGAKKDKLIRFPFSSIHEKEITKNPLPALIKLKNRKKLGLSYNFCCLAIGRFIPLKRFDKLIEIWKSMPSNIGLVLVGEGPEKKKYDALINHYQIKNITILPYMERNKLMSFIPSFDLLLHPTSSDVWGLIINEAFASGIPVVTTYKCLASEVMIKEGVNGYIDLFYDYLKIQNLVIKLKENNDILYKLSKNAIQTCFQFTLEKMVYSHIEFLKNEQKKN
jgi:glycosyltransferase involved in cell wall biosynthesis